jgi:hypothetical protein
MFEDFVFIDFGSGKEELFCWPPNMVSDESWAGILAGA